MNRAIRGAWHWLPWLVICVGMVGSASAQDPPKDKKKPVVKCFAEDAVRRAYKRVRSDDDEVLTRFSVIQSKDDAGDVAICVAEFVSGSVGIYYGPGDEAKDQFMILAKPDLAVVDEALTRAQRK